MFNRRLLQLFIDNRGVKDAARRFEIVNADQDEATVYLYDMIVSSQWEADFWGGVAAEQFVKDFTAIAAPTIHLRINSPGGDVFAARAMEHAVRSHKSNVIAHVDGYAASAATYIALAGKEVEIVDGGFFMVHESWTFAYGNKRDLEKTGGLLAQIDETIVSTYAKRTGLDTETLNVMLEAETWIGAQQAVDEKWADRVAGEQPKDRVNWNVTALLPRASRYPSSKPPAPAPKDTSRDEYIRRQNHVERIAA